MLTRRQTFKLLVGAAALALVPSLPAGAQIAVADEAGALLPMDGSYVTIKEFPELAELLLADDDSYKRFLDETADADRWTRILPHLSPQEVKDCVDSATAQRARYQTIRSDDGLSVRLPAMNTGQQHWDGKNWITYAHFIQARLDSTGTAIGTEVIVRNLAETHGNA